MKRARSKNMTRIMAVLLFMIMLTIPLAFSETAVWDCPECGRTGNTGNYCGGCAHPAPWIKAEDNESISFTQEFKTVGNIVTFGTYPQMADGTDQTPIEWIVLDYDENNHKALLLSRYGLIAGQYNNAWTEITWEKCSLRKWMNGEFLNKAFSEAEQYKILTTVVDNSAGQGYWNTDGGSNTQDKIFLLSCAEAERYLGVTYDGGNNTDSRAAPTSFAKEQGGWKNDSYLTKNGESAGWWWLRSPGRNQNFAAYVNYSGLLDEIIVNRKNGIIRPALWVNLKDGIN